MTHLLDTDHLSVLQRPTGQEYPTRVANINLHPVGDVVASIVSFHEQALGAHNLINQSRTAAEMVRRYELLSQVLVGFSGLTVLPFDDPAAATLDSLKAQKIRIGAMDLRIAAIA
jgi:tRNA(fMet)-specific endonuclease VapC